MAENNQVPNASADDVAEEVEEDVSENEILEWYKSEVQDLWEKNTASAFGELSSNFTEMFRQVMNDVRQRNQPNQEHDSTSSTQPASSSSHVNGHSSSTPNGSETNLSANAPHPMNTISMSSDQLMAMLEDDENWLEDTVNKPTQEEENMVLSVQLTDSNNLPSHIEEDQQNGTGER